MHRLRVRALCRVAASVIVAAGLAGCAPVQPGCNPATAREIRTVDRLIADTEAVIARGYRTESAPRSGLNLCLGGATDNVGLSFCSDGDRRQAVAIDRQAEQRKLDGLMARRTALSRQQAAEASSCRGSG